MRSEYIVLGAGTTAAIYGIKVNGRLKNTGVCSQTQQTF
jgi:hypothetical protein